MHREFIFEKPNKHNWNCIKESVLNALTNYAFNSNQDFVVHIDKYSPTRSGKQLRSYWRLINVVKKYMNDQGNSFSDEEVSSYFKDVAGLYKTSSIGIKEYKSLSRSKKKQKVTREEMRLLIEKILSFGEQNNISDCYIEPRELTELLKYYEVGND